MFRSLSRLLPFSLLALCSLRGAILLDNTQVMEDRPDEESFQAIGQSWGRFVAFKTTQKPYALDSVSFVLAQDASRRGRAVDATVSLALFGASVKVDRRGNEIIQPSGGQPLAIQVFQVQDVPHVDSENPLYYSFELKGFEVEADTAYAIGLIQASDLGEEGGLLVGTCDPDLRRADGVFGDSGYGGWFSGDPDDLEWSPSSRHSAVFMEGTPLPESIASLPPAITDEDFPDFAELPHAKVELGRMLFFDKILSGNQNIACATCHHPSTGTGDGTSLPIGEGGRSLGLSRFEQNPILERVPRNSPALFNLGAKDIKVLFHDGRVAINPEHESGFDTPARDALPKGLDHILAAQAMFPVTSPAEMAGQYDGILDQGENPIATLAAAGDLPAIWATLADRLQAIPAYVDPFKAAFEDVLTAEDITFVHAAKAIAAFEAFQWRADQSPFDQFLRGDLDALSAAQQRGLELFYGEADCASCHSGKLLTDQRFHAIGMPQFGPGKGDGSAGYEDFGREQVTGLARDRYRFRTPALRNVALTGPWGHTGAYRRLEDVVLHHLQPESGLRSYDREQALLPSLVSLENDDWVCLDDPQVVEAMTDRIEIMPLELSPAQVNDLVSFLHALTDPSSLNTLSQIPARVPSGLPVGD